MNVFLPIKPEYAFAIFEGTKKYEFRKAGFGRDVKRIVVYASSPYKKIIGYFEVKDVHKDNPKALWKRFKPFAGICKDDFFSYFDDKPTGVSIEVKRTISFSKHVEPKNIFSEFAIPQSFKYLTESEFESIKEATDASLVSF